jgi:hypothetical protein
MCGSHSYVPLDDILPPQAEDMINDIGVDSDDDADMQYPNPISFQMMTTGLQQFEWKRQKNIIKQHHYLEVIGNCAVGLFADYEESIAADEVVACLSKHNHIENPPAAGSLANRKSCPAAN